MCNKELHSHPTQTKCCGCDNLTTVKDDKITALDLTLVELISKPDQKNNSSSLLQEKTLHIKKQEETVKLEKWSLKLNELGNPKAFQKMILNYLLYHWMIIFFMLNKMVDQTQKM